MLEALAHWFAHELGCEPDEVIVQKGDTLWSIAHNGTGDGSRWEELAAANPDKGWDDRHTTIRPGEKIKLPLSWREGGTRG